MEQIGAQAAKFCRAIPREEEKVSRSLLQE